MQFLKKERCAFEFGFILFDPYTTIEEFKLNLDFFESIQYWKLPVYNRPISSFPELVVTDGCDIYKKLVEDGLIISDENYEYQYKFHDEKMNILYNYFKEWRECILKIRHINVFSYFQYERNREEMEEYVLLCSKYLWIDYMFLRKATDIIIENSDNREKLDILLIKMKETVHILLMEILKFK